MKMNEHKENKIIYVSIFQERMFQCWFNTFFVTEEETSPTQNGAGPCSDVRYKYLTLTMKKNELDKANKDKQNKIYDKNFKVKYIPLYILHFLSNISGKTVLWFRA